MNSGTMITNALNRLGLSVNDWLMRMMALDMLNEICQEHWIYKEWKFRKLNSSFATVAGTSEYTLHRRLGALSDIVDSSLRGSDPVRTIGFMSTQDFFKQHPYQAVSGTPYKSYPGQIRGVSADPSAASVISFVSSFTNYTTGTVTVVQGSNRVIFAGGASIPQNYIGAWFRVTGDQQAYQLQKRDLSSTTIFYLSSAYQGISATTTYTIGDINQQATVVGTLASGAVIEEEVQLSGSTASVTTNSFITLLKISKSDKTMGTITATSNAGVVTNLILDSGDTDIELFGLILYPTPAAVETITYEFTAQHPTLYKASDSPLFPNQYHPLLQLDLYIKLLTEWLKQEPTQFVVARRQQLLNNMIDIDNNTDNWKKLQETEYMSTRAKISNLPPMYGTDYDDQAL